jgi:ribosome maturation factor RimP
MTDTAVAAPNRANTSVAKTLAERELIEKVEAVLENIGFELRDLSILGSGHSATVRITLDKGTTSPTGAQEGQEISIDDCSRAHQVLGPMFDVWDPLPGAYTLEVSSPGEKPPLRLLRHFKQILGEKVQLQTLEAMPMPPPAKARRNWEGILSEVDESAGKIRISDSFGEHWLELAKIRSATWLREWTLPGKGGSESSPRAQSGAGKTKRNSQKRKEK